MSQIFKDLSNLQKISDILNPLIILDGDNSIQFCSKPFYAFANVSPRQIRKAKDVNDLLGSIEASELVKKARETDKAVKSEEVAITVNDVEFIVVLEAYSLEDSNNVVLSFHDFTVEKGLQEKYKEKLKSLNNAYQKVEEAKKNEAYAFISAGICHELTPPITRVTSEIFTLKAALKENSAALSQIEVIDEEVNKMLSLINSTRQTSDTVNFSQWRLVNVTELVVDSVDYYSSINTKSNIDFDESSIKDLGLAWVNSEKIKQVIFNLLENASFAVKSQKDGKVTIEIKRERSEIVIKVIDNGKGVPEDLKDKIFDAFFTTKNAEDGTGLGLALCLQMTNENFGELKLIPSSQGATFEVRLPIAEDALTMTVAQIQANSITVQTDLVFNSSVDFLNETLSKGSNKNILLPVFDLNCLKGILEMSSTGKIFVDMAMKTEIEDSEDYKDEEICFYRNLKDLQEQIQKA